MLCEGPLHPLTYPNTQFAVCLHKTYISTFSGIFLHIKIHNFYCLTLTEGALSHDLKHQYKEMINNMTV